MMQKYWTSTIIFIGFFFSVQYLINILTVAKILDTFFN